MKERFPVEVPKQGPKEPAVFEEWLDKETHRKFSEFLERVPSGLVDNGIRNRLLVLGLQIQLAKNLLDEDEQKKFDEMLKQIDPDEMDENEMKLYSESRFKEVFARTFEKEIKIPEFDYPKKLAVFIFKLQSLGFEVSEPRSHDDRDYFLKLSFYRGAS